MRTAIVGYTGFVGSNLCASHHFDACYNSKNIKDAFETHPDLLIYSGVRSEMYLANKFPDRDLAIIEEAIENIHRIGAKRVVLISSIAVYNQTFDVNESVTINKEFSTSYGRNRRMLEEWVEEHCPSSFLIVRLPGIYGINLKKNFLFDMVHIIPSMLKETKYYDLSAKSHLIASSYRMQDNGFAKCTITDKSLLDELKKEFCKQDFTALSFTDSRGVYQYYYLSHLWTLIDRALAANINILNVAVEPVTAAEIYEYVNEGKTFVNELDNPIAHFDFQTIHDKELGGKNGYLMDKETCLNDIKRFVLSKSL